MLDTKYSISIIVPCFNEEACISACHERLTNVLLSMNVWYEIVYVDDGSYDSTFSALRGIHITDPNVTVLSLSRNFGHQAAVTAGLEIAKGEVVVIIDADLQDPPELIPQMMDIWKQGYKVVYGVRQIREGENHFKLWTAKAFYRVINTMSELKIPLDTGDFRLLDRKAVNAILAMPERHRFLRGMASWIGFRQYGLVHTRHVRFAGTTKYPLRKMINLALDGIASFSIVPLHLVTIAGFAAASLSFAGIIYAIFLRIFTHIWVEGWTLLFVGMLFMGGLQMICLGVVGEYVGRIYTESKRRPLYVVQEIYNRRGDNDTSYDMRTSLPEVSKS